MTTAWSAGELERIGGAEELRIATRRADGTPRREVPVWVVRAGDQVYVRTWYRRDTGWFGHALRSHRACIRVPGLEADVTVEDVGEGPAEAVGQNPADGRLARPPVPDQGQAAAPVQVVPHPRTGPSFRRTTSRITSSGASRPV